MGFMHMVEEGEGITFIPSLAKAYLSEEQLKMVRSFTIPRPIRAIQLVWHKDYVRHTLLNKLEETIKERFLRRCSPSLLDKNWLNNRTNDIKHFY